MRVKDKVALVTGAGSGLGEAISARLAEEGATVVVADIDESSAQRVAEAIGGSAIAVQQDVTDEQRWQELVAEIVERYGQLDILVNNAGIALVGTVEDTTLEDWQRTQRGNRDAVLMGTREAMPLAKNVLASRGSSRG